MKIGTIPETEKHYGFNMEVDNEGDVRVTEFSDSVPGNSTLLFSEDQLDALIELLQLAKAYRPLKVGDKVLGDTAVVVEDRGDTVLVCDRDLNLKEITKAEALGFGAKPEKRYEMSDDGSCMAPLGVDPRSPSTKTFRRRAYRSICEGWILYDAGVLERVRDQVTFDEAVAWVTE